ncbi:MAG: NAD(P)-dependent alcohol dehydrogenase [Flavobacteriaceae bacterium]|nr:MAG: NAD(P)-dependent alcohol dehydrogenase [Flavobacteriaceae bacterium]
MKAVVYTQYGPPEVLQLKEVAQPIPNKNEVLVRVHATTVNRTDCAILSAKPFIMRFFIGLFTPKKSIMGTTFAGEIEAVGKDVTSFSVGDRVFGFNDGVLSSYAEYMVIAEDNYFVTIPDDISYEHAAASIEGEHYAYNFINKAAIKEGDIILVNGASGAIGAGMVQLLQVMKVDITAVTNTKNMALATSLGANRVIDYTKEDFTKENQQYDYIFDTVGKNSFGKCKPILKPKGIYISSELGPWSQNIFYSLFTPMFGGKKVKFPLPIDINDSLQVVKNLMEAGEHKAVIDRKYPLEEIAAAFRYVATGEKTGNVVITLQVQQ